MMPDSVRAFWKGSEKADMVWNDECRMANDEGFGNMIDALGESRGREKLMAGGGDAGRVR
jgi:hypothetical protein